MKIKILILILLITSGISQAAIVNIDDGAYHLVNDNTYQSDSVLLDETIANNPGTHVEMVDGGLVYDLALFNNAKITMSGGSVGGLLVANDNGTITMSGGSVMDHLFADENAIVTMSGGEVVGGIGVYKNASITMYDGLVGGLSSYHNATATMYGGSVGGLASLDNSTVTIYGGSIDNRLIARETSTVTMSGGSVGNALEAHQTSTVTMSGGTVENFLYAYHDSSIYLDGTGFQITDLDGNTTSLSEGDKLSDFGTLVEYIFNPTENPISYYYYSGTITGILADGSALNNTFETWKTGPTGGTAEITIVPEPGSLLLFGFGALIIFKRKRLNK